MLRWPSAGLIFVEASFIFCFARRTKGRERTRDFANIDKVGELSAVVLVPRTVNLKAKGGTVGTVDGTSIRTTVQW